MVVNLTYFDPSGKYYSEGLYTTNKERLFEIWNEVRDMQRTRNLPGMMQGHSELHVTIDVPEHPFCHPHLLLIE